MKSMIFITTISTLFTLTALVFTIGCGEKNDGSKGVDTVKAKEGMGASDLPDGLTKEQAAKVVAKIGDETITVGDITQHINRLSPYIRRRWAAPEKRKEFLEKLIRVELLSQEAERLGLQDDPEVQRTVKQVMIRLMVKNDLEKELFPTKIDEKILKDEYEKESDKYHRSAQVRASHIVVKSRPEAEKLLADLKDHLTDARYFRQKARQVSIDDTTKERGGDLGYFSKPGEQREDEPKVKKTVVEAVWKLEKVGDLTDKVIGTEQGFHIAKLTNKRPEMNRSFDSVKRMIENRLLREKRQEIMDKFVEDLKAKAKIEIIEENLDKMKVGVAVPPRVGGDVPNLAKGKRGQRIGSAPNEKKVETQSKSNE